MANGKSLSDTSGSPDSEMARPSSLSSHRGRRGTNPAAKSTSPGGGSLENTVERLKKIKKNEDCESSRTEELTDEQRMESGAATRADAAPAVGGLFRPNLSPSADFPPSIFSTLNGFPPEDSGGLVQQWWQTLAYMAQQQSHNKVLSTGLLPLGIQTSFPLLPPPFGSPPSLLTTGRDLSQEISGAMDLSPATSSVKSPSAKHQPPRLRDESSSPQGHKPQSELSDDGSPSPGEDAGHGDSSPSPHDDGPFRSGSMDSRNSQILNDAIDKPFLCTYNNCNKRFANKFLLKKHEFIHTGERPHQCPFCGKRFNRKDNLLRHKKTHLANALQSSRRRHTLVFGVRDEVPGPQPPSISLQPTMEFGKL